MTAAHPHDHVPRERAPGTDEPATLPAGAFAAWVEGFRAAQRGERPADVPCDGCTACCTSAQFVPIAPDETATLARVPKELQFPAPGLPPGHVVLPYDEHGRCPLLGDRGCTIYEDRPRTCRAYDCRVFAATGMPPDAHQPAIAARAARWRFDLDHDADRAVHAAVQVVARHLTTAGSPSLEGDGAPLPPTAGSRAALAVAAHAVALRTDPASGRPEAVDPGAPAIDAALRDQTTGGPSHADAR
jgi:Fe-S-cluster containining protein